VLYHSHRTKADFIPLGKGDRAGPMDQELLKGQFDTIRDSINSILENDPDNLSSEELLELTHQLDSLLIEQLKKPG
jgi:hypothetical protein